ncbi:hypothetical protein OIE68_41455 [Nocardia vinacea]|uniref:Uncharacterized protein n=1 Tax=Nocardia vinacea TaxID=96468 RepID=A0ABZ1YLB9_9NOCA|nr:hypothetical protein OIE68_41455 [Nocardia vinacea]
MISRGFGAGPNGDQYLDVHRYAIGLEVTLPEPVGVTLDTAPLLDWIR